MRGAAFHQRTFWVAFGITLAACTALWVLAPPRYDTNDDVAIRLSLEGHAVPGEPGTGYVLFSHAALGRTLQLMERLWPGMPWWDLVISGTLIWAIATFVAIAWNAIGRDWVARATIAGALLIVFVPIVVTLQFTISATLAGGAATLLLVTEAGSSRRPRTSVVSMAIALFVVAILVRPLAGMAGVATCGVLLAPLALVSSLVRPRRGAATFAAAAALAAAIFLGLSYADTSLYRLDRAWDEYARYNTMLARLFEWGQASSDRLIGMRAAAGWSENDWDLLPAMWGVDTEVHGFARVRRAYEASGVEAAYSLDGAVPALFRRSAGLTATNVRTVVVDAGYVLAAGLVLAAAYGNRNGILLSTSVGVLFCAVSLGIEAAFRTRPFRLLAPIHACLMMAAVVTVASRLRPVSAVPRVVALSVVCTILIQQTETVASAVAAGLRHMRQVDSEVATLRDLRPSLIVRHADSFPAEIWWRPFHRPAFDLPSIGLGWNNQNPLLQQFLTRTGRQPLLHAMCHDPSILVVAARPDRLEPVETYMREHFHQTVTWTRLNSGSFAVWKCTATTTPDAASGSRRATPGGAEP